MRCPDCNKFVSYEEEDPEVDLDEISEGENAVVTGTVRIVNACQECGTELKEANLEIDLDVGEFVKAHQDDGEANIKDLPVHEIEVVGEDTVARDIRVEGKGRGAKTFYGATGTITLRCKCGKSQDYEWSDYVQASALDNAYS